MTFRPLAIAATLALTVAACGNSSSSSDTSVNPLNTTTDFIVNPIVWTACDGSTSTEVECGNIEVPFDYSDPEQGSFVLYVKKHNASKPASRIGSMMVNPGAQGLAAVHLPMMRSITSAKTSSTISTSLHGTHVAPVNQLPLSIVSIRMTNTSA
jgi:hypothetical protein